MKKNSLTQEPARLVFQNVTCSYGNTPVLDNISFEIPHGAQVAVIGPNGAGKSTLFKALVGLIPLLYGQILIHGQPLGHHQDCVAYIPQREEIDWSFPVTVQDVVLMGRFNQFGWFGRPQVEDQKIVKHCLEQLGIAHLAKRPISDLSGGQQQRVFLARALAQEPHILLMDEPFNGIDFATQETTLRLLDDLRRQHVTVLISTHDLAMASEKFEHVLLLNHRLIAYGAPSEVFKSQHISSAFGGQVLKIDNAIVVDHCCEGCEEREIL
jgi:ABC-type Mn2+/Zn2+ transport system ATPase subunit